MCPFLPITFLFIVFSSQLFGQEMNGFRLTGAIIPVREIKSGGPPRDGIPAINSPVFEKAAVANYPSNMDRILGVEINGVAKAYPIGILNYHEIVNDYFDDAPVVITYCPLCGSGVAFHARIKDKNRTFGVSGLLYNSDVLLYDRESESLWSQIMGQAVTGPLKDTKLEIIPTYYTTWKDWKERYPQTLVLTTKTGFFRDYQRTPYVGYDQSEALYFPVDKLNKSYHPKERILGIEVNGKYKAYPFSELQRSNNQFWDTFNEQKFRILFDKDQQSARILNEQGQEFPSYVSFWFAWAAFHKNTEVYKAN